MDRYFVLDDRGDPLPIGDPEVWADRMARTNRMVARSTIAPTVVVLTEFTGVDLDGEGAVFETHVFGGIFDGTHLVYVSRPEAIAGHAYQVSWCLLGQDDS